MKDNKLHTPDGFRDYLPGVFRVKRSICEQLTRVFETFGYTAVKSPMLEYVEVFEGKGVKDMYRFINRDGDILALRPDMTPPVARIAATHFDVGDHPLRFCYQENVFRFNESYRGRAGEFTEAGVELIGDGSAEADAEVIAVAVESLLSAGLTDFRIDIGHVGFLSGLLEESKLDRRDCDELMDCLIRRDYVAMEQLLCQRTLPDNVGSLLKNLLCLTGGAEILEETAMITSNEKALQALRDLTEISEIIRGSGHGLCEYIQFDLGIIGHLDYYTGMLFRGYSRHSGFSILDGGRYDNLAASFGCPAPSVGFAIRVDNLPAPTDSGPMLTVTGYSKDGGDAARETGHRLRREGHTVVNILSISSREAALQYAREKKADSLLYFDGPSSALMIETKTGAGKRIGVNEVQDAFRNRGWSDTACPARPCNRKDGRI